MNTLFVLANGLMRCAAFVRGHLTLRYNMPQQSRAAACVSLRDVETLDVTKSL